MVIQLMSAHLIRSLKLVFDFVIEVERRLQIIVVKQTTVLKNLASSLCLLVVIFRKNLRLSPRSQILKRRESPKVDEFGEPIILRSSSGLHATC